MSKCKKCNSKMITMSGTTYLEVDAEPYESGIEEKSKIQEVDIHVSAEYCEECDKTEEIHEQ